MKRPFHGGNLAWAARLAGCPPSRIVDFSASINPLGPPQSAIAAIHAEVEHLSAYPDPDYRGLRQALGLFHQLSPDWILPGNGAAELLTWAARELAEFAAVYLITPAFGDYGRSLQAFNAKVIPRLLKTGGDFKLPSPLPHSALLLNNPHNPTGKLWTREAILPLLEQFQLVVVDEAFMDFLPPEAEQSLIPVIQDYPNLVIVRSLTKFYSLPGLRLGYAISHPDRLQQWQQWRDPWAVNSLAVAAGIAAIADTEFQQLTWDWLPQTRTALWQGLNQIPGLQPLPGTANFLLVESVVSTSQLQQTLLQNHQVLIRDCLSFPELGDRFFRIAVRTQTDNQQLLNALQSVINS